MSVGRHVTNGPVHILIAEDSPTQAQRLRHTLERQGFIVTHAANGREAFELAQNQRPALVISDIVMPEMNGYELCRHIKDDAVLGDVPVILVTTLSDPADVIRGLESRADNFILKPYDERYLLSRVQYVLLNRQLRESHPGGLAVEIFFNGQRHVITADRLQILNLLLSTYDAAIERNKELTRAQEQLTKRTEELAARQRELVEGEERMRRILNTAHDAFVGMDDTGKIVEWNVAAQTIFGWSREEALGVPLADLIIPAEHRAGHVAGLDHVRRTGEGPILNKRIQVGALRRNGEEFSAELIVWPIHVGAKRFFNAFIRDITLQMQAETAVRQAKEEAERANHAKSDFLSRMSHDLRTPLNAILGFAQLLETEGVNESQREAVRHILSGGSHLLDLINEVLDIARIEAGHLSLSPEPVPIAQAVNRVVELVQPLATPRGVTLHLDMTACGDAHVLADRQRLNQILMNLLSNAIKYNREGGRVTVRCEQLRDQRLRVKVTDTGAGIPPEKMAFLFQPFERLGAEQTTVEGTGLGLALSKALADAMSGALGVDSVVDQGSTFWVELAVAEHPANRIAPVAAEDRPATTVDDAVAGTVLYIEDNVSNQRLMERLVARRPGVRLISVAQGQAGIDLARTAAPDLILLDLHLPDMHGEEVLRRLWEDPRTRPIPVAVLSADATPSQIARLLAAGARAYLTKPLNIAEVLSLVDRTL